jgi:hypothetical protein
MVTPKENFQNFHVAIQLFFKSFPEDIAFEIYCHKILVHFLINVPDNYLTQIPIF